MVELSTLQTPGAVSFRRVLGGGDKNRGLRQCTFTVSRITGLLPV